MPHNFIFLSTHFIIAKCKLFYHQTCSKTSIASIGYSNSLFATLNSRDALKNRDDSHPMAVHISVDGPDSQPRFFRHNKVRRILKLGYGTGGSSSELFV